VKSVYPTLLDPLTQQITDSITKADILREIKTQALFFDIICPSISHILSSKCTYDALKDQPELLIEGIVQPQIPKPFANIDEYLQWVRMKEEIEWLKKLGIHLTENSYLMLYLNRNSTKLPETTTVADAKILLKERINFINANVKKFWHYDQPTVADLVRISIARDLDPEISPFSKNFKEIDEVKRIRSLALELLDKRGMLDRSILFTYINAQRLVDGILLKRIINRVYFTCGAIVTDHMLSPDPSYIQLLSKGSKELNSIERKYLITRTAFDALLRYLKVDPLIEILDIDSLKKLRKWSKKSLYKTIWNYVERWQRGNITSRDIKDIVKPEINNLNRELEEILKSEINEQRRKYMEIKKREFQFKRTMEGVAFFGTLLTSLGIANLSFLTITSAASKLIADPLFNYLLRKKANLIVFVNEIKKTALP